MLLERKKRRKIGGIVALMGFVLLMLVLLGMSCSYDNEPFLQTFNNQISWHCTMDVSNAPYNCYDYVEYLENYSTNDTGGIVQVNPELKEMDKVGFVNDFYKSNDGMLNALFSGDTIYAGTRYKFNVVCVGINGSVETASDFITPIDKPFYGIGSTLVWGDRNMNFIVPIAIVLILVGLFVWILKRR